MVKKIRLNESDSSVKLDWKKPLVSFTQDERDELPEKFTIIGFDKQNNTHICVVNKRNFYDEQNSLFNKYVYYLATEKDIDEYMKDIIYNENDWRKYLV